MDQTFIEKWNYFWDTIELPDWLADLHANIQAFFGEGVDSILEGILLFFNQIVEAVTLPFRILPALANLVSQLTKTFQGIADWLENGIDFVSAIVDIVPSELGMVFSMMGVVSVFFVIFGRIK
jgi:hypothetical protein